MRVVIGGRAVADFPVASGVGRLGFGHPVLRLAAHLPLFIQVVQSALAVGHFGQDASCLAGIGADGLGAAAR